MIGSRSWSGLKFWSGLKSWSGSRFVDDADAGVGSADGQAGWHDAPDVGFWIVDFHRLQMTETNI